MLLTHSTAANFPCGSGTALLTEVLSSWPGSSDAFPPVSGYAANSSHCNTFPLQKGSEPQLPVREAGGNYQELSVLPKLIKQ